MSYAYAWAVFLPLVSFLVVGILGALMGNLASKIVSAVLLAGACLGGWWIFMDVGLGDHIRVIPLFTWFQVGRFSVSWSLHFDTLSAIMIVVVNTISFMVHIYSIGYMAQDRTIWRFMAYLGLFTFMMLMLVTSGNLVQLFFGWEGVGLASWLLIGYWYEKPSAGAAALKAFIVNRVGDLGLVLGFGAIFLLFRTVDISSILQTASEYSGASFVFAGYSLDALEVICFLLFIGAMGKSAQIGLHTWLPDAMEGPTPVSALIHAATMVTAGVFLLARLSPLYTFAPVAQGVITIVGSLTALFAATVALTQTDIKRVIAWSTCSQLGYMFMAAGVSAWNMAIFHLVTHAFFKALLFLGAGSVIHAMSDEQDMRKMGGIWRSIPVTYSMMWIGSLALAGIPFFAGYYSKDAILEAAREAGTLAGTLAFCSGILAAFLTAFYSWRLIYMVFTGAHRADEHVMGHLHEPGFSMLLPLSILGLGALFAGFFGNNYFHDSHFWSGSIAYGLHSGGHGQKGFMDYLPVLLSVGGIALATLFYHFQPAIPRKISEMFCRAHKLLFNKWYFDELYNIVFVQSAIRLGELLWNKGDGFIINGYGPDGVASWASRVARRFSQIQTGYIYHYALIMIAGVIVGIGWLLLVIK